MAGSARGHRLRRRVPIGGDTNGSETIFLILRRMRVPLIVLITIFAVSVLGLTLIPGQDAAGHPARMGFFDAFYFMSYTASTIGFGEIPYPFTYGQRLWVTVAIYLTVIGWAYAIGSLLALVQDRAFRQALALQQFRRKVARLREPFLLIAGYGRTGELLGHAFDALGRRVVVVDSAGDRIDDLELDSYRADVPGLVGDVRDPGLLGIAGLDHPSCEAVLALTDDDEANLAVTMTAALLRPDLPVVARTTSPAITERMRAFGNPSVVNPFDAFGDHLRLALHAPASYQLLTWLQGGPGAVLPERGEPPQAGRWVVCGASRFGKELSKDLRAEGLEVDVLDEGSALDDLGSAVGFVAGTNNDTTNLSLVAGARRANPDLYLAARQNRPPSGPLFAAMDIDALLVPTQMVAREVYAQLSTPLLRQFLRAMPAQGDAWAAALVDRLASDCGQHLPPLWKVRLTAAEAPALQSWLASGSASVGDLLRDPVDRSRSLRAVALLVLRGDDATLVPEPDFRLAADDEILLAGRPAARRSLDTTLLVDSVGAYVTSGRHIPSSWIWRRLSPGAERRPAADAQRGADAQGPVSPGADGQRRRER
ncbi:MAG TPA: NAD-binding protein [Mycobacteriales bacterium]|nr:NAD-binding protein [Mycobacteriales bacterium]